MKGSVIMITVKEWDTLTPKQQERYTKRNNIEIGLSTNIADQLTKGFGELDDFGFWEYQFKICKSPKRLSWNFKKWYKYIIPHKSQLKNDDPIYRWLFWTIKK